MNPTNEELQLLELQQINLDLDTIITELQKEPPPPTEPTPTEPPPPTEPTPEELAKEQATTDYRQSTLENSDTTNQLLQQLIDLNTTQNATIVEQQTELLEYQQYQKDFGIEQTWTIVFTIVIAIAMKAFAENFTKW